MTTLKSLSPAFALAALAGLVLSGCGDDGGPCGLTCPDLGLAEGNASISGVVSIDAFFGAVLAVRDAAATVSGNVRGELEGIAASLEIEGYQELSFDELALAVQGGLQAKFEANLEGNLVISYEPPRCQANVDVAVQAAAECDVDVDPGMIEVQCMGSCEVSAEVAAQCEAEGTLECTGKAPDFSCSGTCSGSCQLEASAACSGSCRGTCDGECSACVGGECETDGMGNITNCSGSCSGGCEGTCELEAGGECGGRCEGECTYMPAEGGCEAGATAKCDVSAMADVECQGGCEGDVQPPEVSAECQASVEAKAEASVECTPPSLSVEFQFAAGLDADAQAEFKIWLEGFKTRFAGLVAASAKLDSVSGALEGLASASISVVPDAIAEIQGSGELSISVVTGLGCALTEVEAVGTALSSATADVTGSLNAVAMVSASVGN
ncbi:hypothetical protein PPSIR1_41049 [Plesiocystis pacifica SIR-1]|uniref:Lipoprotein n=1 Tax=Plesiocystis pacifica SIR-1 TaxID=391625 RepID=A6GG18_9BACT|nr:hypothetical protein [Plesiocystis pacifica]EDM75205.1 hypothetical protein PPSIR1_41049 [Plesiocystis pacifica SIR-1]